MANGLTYLQALSTCGVQYDPTVDHSGCSSFVLWSSCITGRVLRVIFDSPITLVTRCMIPRVDCRTE
jgi:hypothetical protein